MLFDFSILFHNAVMKSYHLYYFILFENLLVFPNSYAWQFYPCQNVVVPDFAQVYSFIGSVFDPSATGHLQRLKQMDPINLETVRHFEIFL